MFAIVENNTVTRLLPNGGTFTHNDVQRINGFTV